MEKKNGKSRERGNLPARHEGTSSDVGTPNAQYPIEERIARIVSARFAMPVVGVAQEVHCFVSTHSSGIATCTFGNGERRSVFWKMGSQRRGVWAGLRFASVGYEIGAYSSIHKVGEAPAPALIGSEIRETDALLVTEYAGSMWRINKYPETERAMERAAHRIGTFHERASAAAPDSMLDRYDERMFGFWASQAARRFPDVPWMTRVSDAFPSFASALQATSSTVIHGEFYPANVLASTDRIMAVDWEWAGMGMGEIDLAALTENWAESTVAACTAAYAQSRRIHPSDKLFRRRLAVSQLYFHLCWLGGRGSLPMAEEERLRLENVRSLAAELGIL